MYNHTGHLVFSRSKPQQFSELSVKAALRCPSFQALGLPPPILVVVFAPSGCLRPRLTHRIVFLTLSALSPTAGNPPSNPLGARKDVVDYRGFECSWVSVGRS